MKFGRRIAPAAVASVALASLTCVSAPARADNSASVQKQKNDWRNLGIGAGAIALHGLVRGNGLETILGAAGAAYAGKRYEEERQRQSRMQREQERNYYRSGNMPSTYDNGYRKYYWYNGQEYYLDENTGERYPVGAMAPVDSYEQTTTVTREYHRRGDDRKYYRYNGHEYYLDLNTGERVFVY